MNGRPPGFLSPRVTPDVLMMICTAGHVDHGKTQLVKLLTGCSTDRLKAEQERGMTIELGFAPCYLGDNVCAGIVDVPGHEKFVKTMVAGVSGIDVAILVIAADDGIMPQTVEHVQIMQLLGVRNGVVALTKIDLISPTHVQQKTEEIRLFLKDTFLADAPICPVSSETFEGYPQFYETVVREIKNTVRSARAGIFRMPIERVFSRPGFGTVCTGIPVAGAIAIGDQVGVIPGNQVGKVRGIQRFLRDATEGGCGQCLALNIPDLDKGVLQRGQVLCRPGYLKASSQFHVTLTVVPTLDKPLRNAESVKFHTGTAEESGKVHLLEEKQARPGHAALATVVLQRPVAGAVHDRFILRRPSPATTVAGGEILAISHVGPPPRRPDIVHGLREYQALFRDADPTGREGLDRRVEFFLRHRQTHGASTDTVAQEILLPPDEAQAILTRLIEKGRVRALAGDFFIHSQSYRRCLAEVEGRLKEATSQDKALSLKLNDLRQHYSWPAALWNHVVAQLEQSGTIRRRGEKLILQGAVEALDQTERDLLARLLRVYEETGFHSPRPDELPAMLGTTQSEIDRLLDHLCNEGLLIRLAKPVILSYAHFRKAQEMVVRAILEKGKLDSADFKHYINSTRKYALAILDFLDSRRVTIRIGNDRKLTADYQKHLL